MHVHSILPAQPAGCRLAAQRPCKRSSCRRALAVVPRAQQGAGPAGQDGDALAAAAEQQAAAAVAALPTAQAVADTAEGEDHEDEQAAASYTPDADALAAAEEAEQATALQAVPGSGSGGPGGRTLSINLEHPGVKVAGYTAGVFLGGTLLITLFRMARDPQRRRSKTINKNKLVVDTIAKYLPGNRAALNSATFTLLKVQTGFSDVELFRKYLWFMLRERQFDEEAVGDLVALKAALALSDAQVADALRERAERVYEKYGTVMVNLEGMSQAGIERKAASRNLFIKLLSLTESRSVLGAEAAATVDLGKIFGVTQRDILTLRSGYSAEVEGGGEEAANSDDE